MVPSFCLLLLLISQVIQIQPSPKACFVLTAAEYGTMLPILISQLIQTQPSPEACPVLTADEYGTKLPTPASHWSADPNPTIP
jgi:hypothetical protein